MFRGVVSPGDRRGRLLGFPTANLTIIAGRTPADGIYACIVRLGGETSSRGATTSVGDNPTFADVASRRVEVHVHDFAGDLYGRELEVHIVRLLRPTARFSSPGELMRRSAEDVRRSRALLLRLGPS